MLANRQRLLRVVCLVLFALCSVDAIRKRTVAVEGNENLEIFREAKRGTIQEHRCLTCDFNVGGGFQGRNLAASGSTGLSVDGPLEPSFQIQFWFRYEQDMTEPFPLVSSSHGDWTLEVSETGTIRFYLLDMEGTTNCERTKIIDLNDCGFADKLNWNHVSLELQQRDGDVQYVRIYHNGELACVWKGSFGQYTRISRQDHFIFGQSFSVDDVRVWTGINAQTEDQIRSRIDLPLSGDEPGLVFYNSFDDSSEGDEVRSTIPLRTFYVDDGEFPKKVCFITYNPNPEDEFIVIANGGFSSGSAFRDEAATIPYDLNDPIEVLPGDMFPCVWYVPFEAGPVVESILFAAASRSVQGEFVMSKDDFGNEEFARLEIGREGCNGRGALSDDCGDCDGNNFHNCIRGCDQKPFSVLEFDDCGVCGGDDHDGCLSGCDNTTLSDLEEDLCGECNGTNDCLCEIEDEFRGNFVGADIDLWLLYCRLEELLEDVCTTEENLRGIKAVVQDGAFSDLSWFEKTDFINALREFAVEARSATNFFLP